MSNDYHPHNLSDLLNVINAEWNKLESMIIQVSDSQKMVSGVEGRWSIKDIMAHVAAWEKFAHDRINSALTGESLKFPVIEGENFIDEFNQQIYEENKDIPLENVETDFYSSHRKFFEQIQSLDDDILSQKLPFVWAGDLTFQILISANTHWHYIDHAKSINKWLEKLNN